MSAAPFAPVLSRPTYNSGKDSLPTDQARESLRLDRPRIGLDEANDVLLELIRHIERCPRDASIDLSDVKEASSVAVAVLVRAAQIARCTGKRLIVKAGSPVIHCLVKVNKLDSLIHSRDRGTNRTVPPPATTAN